MRTHGHLHARRRGQDQRPVEEHVRRDGCQQQRPMRGVDDRGPNRKRVARRTRRRGHDQPIGCVSGEEGVVEADRQSQRAQGDRPFEGYFVECVVHRSVELGARRMHVHIEQHALFDVEVAGEE